METRDGVGSVAWQPFVGVRETPAEYVIYRPKLYLDTTIPSYLTARPSRDLEKTRQQRVTQEWWWFYRWQYEIYYSEYVLQEAPKGDRQAANKRIESLMPFNWIAENSAAEEFAERILKATRLPEKARADAIHVALAAMHPLQYLITWNCKHLANQHLRPKIMHICHREGYTAPLIRTPEELIDLRPHEIPNRR